MSEHISDDKHKAPSPAVLDAVATNAVGGGLHIGAVAALVTDSQALITLPDERRLHARQAASCLLAPAIGDRVLAYVCDEEAYILNVLERDQSLPAQVMAPGASEMKICATGRLELTAPHVRLTSKRLTILSDMVAQTGRQLVANFSKTFETIVDKVVSARSITTSAQIRTSSIRETDTVHAGVLVENIDSVATQNSEISMVTAKEDVRLDAKRVSVG